LNFITEWFYLLTYVYIQCILLLSHKKEIEMTQEQAVDKARNFARITGMMAVIWFDYDENIWCVSSEDSWDRMVDNGMVEVNWCWCVITY
jgi:hypothetical protein